MNKVLKCLVFCVLVLSLIGCNTILPTPTQPLPGNTPDQTTVIVESSITPSLTNTALPTITPSATIEPLPIAPGEIWLVNETDHTLLCYDAQTLALITSVPTKGAVTSLSQGRYGVWAIEESTQEIIQIDPVQHSITARIPLPGYTLHALAASEEGIWVGVQPITPATPSGPGTPPGGGLVLLNPETLTVDTLIELGAPVTDMEVYGGWVWAVASANGFSALFIIDPETLTPFQPSRDELWYDQTQIAVNSTGVWLINSMLPDTLVLLDIQNGSEQQRIKLDGMKGSTYTLAATETGVWVLSNKGEVVKVDPANKNVEAVFPVASREAELFIGDDMLWVLSQWDGMIYAIDPVQDRVVVMVTTGERRPTPTRTPTITPYPTEAPMPPCKAGYETRLKVGARALVQSKEALPNRIREQPGLDGKVLGFVQQYEEVDILGGPVCSNNWVWWKVRSVQSHIVGWTAEGDEETYWLQPEE